LQDQSQAVPEAFTQKIVSDPRARSQHINWPHRCCGPARASPHIWR